MLIYSLYISSAIFCSIISALGTIFNSVPQIHDNCFLAFVPSHYVLMVSSSVVSSGPIPTFYCHCHCWELSPHIYYFSATDPITLFRLITALYRFIRITIHVMSEPCFQPFSEKTFSISLNLYLQDPIKFLIDCSLELRPQSC